MPIVPIDADLRVYTRIRNPHPTREVFLSFIPPHGRRMMPLETFYIPGNLVGEINKQSRRNQVALVKAVTQGACEIMEGPADFFYDLGDQDIKILEVNSGQLTAVPYFGAGSSSASGGEPEPEPEVPTGYSVQVNDNQNVYFDPTNGEDVPIRIFGYVEGDEYSLVLTSLIEEGGSFEYTGTLGPMTEGDHCIILVDYTQFAFGTVRASLTITNGNGSGTPVHAYAAYYPVPIEEPGLPVLHTANRNAADSREIVQGTTGVSKAFMLVTTEDSATNIPTVVDSAGNAWDPYDISPYEVNGTGKKMYVFHTVGPFISQEENTVTVNSDGAICPFIAFFLSAASDAGEPVLHGTFQPKTDAGGVFESSDPGGEVSVEFPSLCFLICAVDSVVPTVFIFLPQAFEDTKDGHQLGGNYVPFQVGYAESGAGQIAASITVSDDPDVGLFGFIAVRSPNNQ